MRNHGGDGGEYGATTGRPRRMGWFDAVASRYGCEIQGATEVALTVLDFLGYLKEIPFAFFQFQVDCNSYISFPFHKFVKTYKSNVQSKKPWTYNLF